MSEAQIHIHEGKVKLKSGLKMAYKYLSMPDERRETVVIFPGGPGFGYALYEGHSDFLQAEVDIVYFDPLGCGQSDKPEMGYDYSMADYVEGVRQLLAFLSVTGVTVIGTSYGGMTAQKFALMYPELCKRLILVSTAPSFHFLQVAQQWVAQNSVLTEEHRKACARLFGGRFDNEGEVNHFLSVMLPFYSCTSDHPEKAYSAFDCAREPLNWMFACEYERFDFIPQLTALTLPVLILAGEKDWIIDPQFARQLNNTLPQSELHIFEGSGHAVAKDCSQDYKKLILEFLSVS